MASQNGDSNGKVNNNNTSSPLTANNLASSLNRLSLNSTTSSSVPATSPRRSFSHSQTSPPDGTNARRTLHRSPSSMSMYSGSPSAAMHRSPSAMGRSPSSMSMHSPAIPPRTRTSMSSYHGVTPPRSRRSSPSPHPASMGRSPLATVADVPVYTARGIASTHFASELEMHSDITEQRPANTIIILHDSCYGHRFSRPRTTKSGLALIVERPERIQASVLGVSVAYVRLGGRHDEGSFPLHPKREVSSLPSIPFRIRKTGRRLTLSSPAVINVHGTKWMEELKLMCNSAEAKLATTGKELARDSSKTGEDLPGKLHEGDLYLCAESLEAMEGALGAVCEGVDAVFNGSVVEGGPSRAFVVVRPPGHHCSSNYPSGFCWLNNVHVGIQHAILNHGLTHAAIIDFDLHHGDGSQSIAWEHNTRASNAAKNAAAWKKTSIGYFSLHDINSYPCEQGDDEKVRNASVCIDNAHGQNIWNVHLETWKNEEEFWELYEVKYSVLLQKARKFLKAQTETRSSSTSAPPKAAIFISAGFDASEWESGGMQRHKVNVPTEFYARLSRDVVKLASEEGLGVDGRIISVLEGGYSDRALMTGVLSHISGLTGGDPVIREEATRPGLAREMGRKLGSFDGAKGFHLDASPYDIDWWSRPRLDQLDLVLNPSPVPEPFKPTRAAALGNFSSPTQSFIAKVVPHRRTSYGASIETPPRQTPVRRVSSPKPPDVDWAIAAHELSKLLIPSDRQVASCRPEELSAAATRDRKERQSVLNLSENSDGPQPMGPPEKTNRMALRERKAKSYVDEEDEFSRPASKAGRRKTVAPSHSISPPQPEPQKPIRQSGRRQSMVSNAPSTISEAPSMSVNGRGRLPSVQLNGHPRPDTAQSIRPESSMSVRGTTGGAKKTFGAGPGRPSSRMRKTSATNVSNKDGAAEAPALPNAPVAPLNSSEDSSVDNITSGMGKIKLTLVTKAQREAKEKEKSKEAKPTTSKAPRKPTGTRMPKTCATAPKPKQAQRDASKSNQPTVIKEESSSSNMDGAADDAVVIKEEPNLSNMGGAADDSHVVIKEEPNIFGMDGAAEDIELPPYPSLPNQNTNQLQPFEALQAPLPPSSPASKTTTPQKISPDLPHVPLGSSVPQSNGHGVFPPYNPISPVRDPAPQHQSETLPRLAPNVSTPVAAMKRHELPVFTSTSPIRFGVQDQQVANGSGSRQIDEGGVENSGAGDVNGEQDEQNGQKFDASVWEIPETPQ